MSRAYKGVFVKKYRVYSVDDLMTLYSVSANTVSNWRREGLARSDSISPNLFQGAAVIQFHQQRRDRSRRNLRPGEFKCLKCKAAVFPEIETIRDVVRSSGKQMYAAECPDCLAQVWKIPSETDRDIIEDCRNPNTSRSHLHEGNSTDPAGIWISEEKNSADLWFENDRIIYKWLTYAGRYDEKTVDCHLAAIRYSEKLNGGKSLNLFTIDDVSKVRDDLKRRAKADAPDRLAASSIKHIVSHLTAFFQWLLKQDGFKRLPKDIPDYFKLPKAALAAALPTKPKEYPSISEAADILQAIPSTSLSDKRARAIFALAFLSGLRADTLVSLRVEYFNIPDRQIVQDASVLRAKAGKSLNITWFPIPKCFETTVIEWVNFLEQMGFRGSDALFPNTKWLTHRKQMWDQDRQPVPVMSTKHAVTRAFAIACHSSDRRYTPHAVKHSLAAERDSRPLTQLARKAWSENLGHESEGITEKHYGKMSDDHRAEVLEDIGTNSSTDLLELSVDEKAAILDDVLKLLLSR